MDLETLEWNWIGGRDSMPSETGTYTGRDQWPGGRAGSIASLVPVCSEDTLLYLHGGYGYGVSSFYEGRLGDSWLYNVTSMSWRWIGGSTAANDRTSYAGSGVLGGRAFSVGWLFQPVDTSVCRVDGGEIDEVKLLLFGGSSLVDGEVGDARNDLWLLDVSVNNDILLVALVVTSVLLTVVGIAALVILWSCCKAVRRCCCSKDGCCCRSRYYQQIEDVL